MSNSIAIVGDIGGTNFRLALSVGEKLTNIREFPYTDQDTPERLIRAYLKECGAEKKITEGVFAVASPSTDPSRVVFTNGAWKQRPVSFELEGVTSTVINDFAAITYAVVSLKPKDCRHIAGPEPFLPSRLLKTNKGDISQGRILTSKPLHRYVVVGPGTGLGVSSAQVMETNQILVTDGEGGHASFSPDSQEELAVKDYIQSEKDIEVTMETMASGTGLPVVFNAYAKVIGKPYEAETARDVAEYARTGTFSEKRCARWTLDLFAKTLGRCASSAVLTTNARTVYIAGGMPLHLGSQFRQSAFLDAFHQNDLGANNITEEVSVAMIRHPQPGLLGAHAFFQLNH